MPRKFLIIVVVFSIVSTFFSCEKKSASSQEIAQLKEQLFSEKLEERTRCAVLKKLALRLHEQNPQEMVLFLTNWVENHKDDTYNAYWLFMVATEYTRKESKPVAEYYYERILKDFPDLIINGQSVHFECLQNLIKISENARNRIEYYNTLIQSFSEKVSITELYVRLAIEYEKEGEWENALKSYSLFLKQDDASSIQIQGIPDAYMNARKMVDFSKSPKNWTFESLSALEKAVKDAITEYSWKKLDALRSKSNFFMMSWKAIEGSANSQAEFSMQKFMRGNKIRYNADFDSSSTPNEAYLRTSGWNSYVGVWYLYFRKVNFPVDPDKHGQWEWAGIYLGEKL